MTLLALAALSVLVYTYLGYPVVIGLLARFRPQPVDEDPGYLPTVTACVPVHDASAYLERKLESLLALDYPEDRLQILVYSDGSTDGTADVAERFAARDPRVKVLRASQRRGKPTALNAMRNAASGEVLLMTDVRQPLARGALRALVRKLADPTVACVSGNLVLAGSAGSGVYWRYENWLRKQEALYRGMVGVTGPLYAIRREDLPPVPEGVILDDVWIPMRLRLEGRRILFAEDAVAHDEAFADDREFGRKVRTLAGNYQLFALLPELLLPPRNPSWFETFSHKVLRLAGPWAMLVLLGASATGWWLGLDASPAMGWRAVSVLLLAQVGFYGLVLLGAWAGRLGSVARTFAIVNVAALVGLWRYMRGSQRVTW